MDAPRWPRRPKHCSPAALAAQVLSPRSVCAAPRRVYGPSAAPPQRLRRKRCAPTAFAVQALGSNRVGIPDAVPQRRLHPTRCAPRAPKGLASSRTVANCTATASSVGHRARGQPKTGTKRTGAAFQKTAAFGPCRYSTLPGFCGAVFSTALGRHGRAMAFVLQIWRRLRGSLARMSTR